MIKWTSGNQSRTSTFGRHSYCRTSVFFRNLWALHLARIFVKPPYGERDSCHNVTLVFVCVCAHLSLHPDLFQPELLYFGMDFKIIYHNRPCRVEVPFESFIKVGQIKVMQASQVHPWQPSGFFSKELKNTKICL